MDFLNKIEDEALRAELKTAIEKELADVKDAAKNDAELARDYKLQGFKEAERKLKRDFKKVFGVDSSELDDVDTSNGFEALFAVGANNLKASKDSSSQEWQDKFLALKEDYNKLKDEEIPTLQTKAEQEIKQYKISNKLNTKILSLDNLSIPKDDLTLLVKSKLDSMGVVLELDDNGVQALTKDNTKPLINDKAVDFDGLINHIVTPYIKQNGSTDAKPNPTLGSVSNQLDGEAAIRAKWASIAG